MMLVEGSFHSHWINVVGEDLLKNLTVCVDEDTKMVLQAVVNGLTDSPQPVEPLAIQLDPNAMI